MRIVIVAHNLGMGGVERASSNLANALSKLGHEVCFLALIPKPKFFQLNQEVAYMEPLGFNHKRLHFFRTLSYIREKVGKLDPDFVVCFTKFFYSVTNLALVGTRHKILVSERSSPYYKWPVHIRLFGWLSNMIRRPYGVLSQTSIAADVHRKYYRSSNVFVLPNALRPVQLYPEIKRKNILLCVGRFGDPCKGFDLMVRAYNLIPNTDWELHFVGGDRAEGAYLLGLAKDDDTRGRIRLRGRIENLDAVFAEAGIFVIPSRSEGFPNALVEAMAAGVPVISFDFISGPRDIISDGVDGIIVPANDVEALARSVEELIADRRLREVFSTHAQAKALTFQEDSIAKRFTQYLNDHVENSSKFSAISL